MKKVYLKNGRIKYLERKLGYDNIDSVDDILQELEDETNLAVANQNR